MDADRRIAALEDENATLRERIRALEEQLIGTWDLPLEWELTAQEARVVGCLIQRELASKEQLMHALYADMIDADAMVEPKIVDVFICKIRKKLAKFNLEIETVWGRGYKLTPLTRDLIRGVWKAVA